MNKFGIPDSVINSVNAVLEAGTKMPRQLKDPKKVQTKIKLKGESIELRDILRYTIVYPTDEYTQGVYNIFTEMMNHKHYKTKHK